MCKSALIYMKKLFIIISIIIVLFIGMVMLLGSSKYELDVISGETVAYTSLRYAIAQSNYDGSGEISQEKFNVLGNMVKKFNSSAEWFSNSSYRFSGKIVDTSEKQITVITDGEYVATFTIENDGDNYYLLEYTFENKKVSNCAKFKVIE